MCVLKDFYVHCCIPYVYVFLKPFMCVLCVLGNHLSCAAAQNRIIYTLYMPQETCTLKYKNPRMVKQPLRTEWCLGEDQDIPGQYSQRVNMVKMVKIAKIVNVVKMVKMIGNLFIYQVRSIQHLFPTGGGGDEDDIPDLPNPTSTG